ncbi:hypothetical protein SAMN05444161_7508 [Rhizobiales bacterium GAS191]|nr:hypothetical protein SAMN05444161_7508 [Rhizobiales bacterium GAS191]
MLDPQGRLKLTSWMLVALAASTVLGCANVHCSTEGKGGGPGGCGLDMKFNTSDTLVMPDSPGSPSSPPLPPP